MYDQNFYWGGGGGGWGERVAVKGVVGVIKGSFQKHLKTGGGGFEGATTLAPPGKL